ncbi:MAG: hydroxyacylglutathione hydrolase [Kofleriaceae bacterium]|nr:hydroxyacylglutathione hydrolase [Myxococcales bacterium]MCB9573304.1 hydroxyacylglutathione hydrolase [Kofleriaceae bacterium]
MPRIVAVPCLKDNYAYLVVCPTTGRAAIVDPGEAAPVLEAVRREGVTLAAVWATHHHPDHVAGIEGVIAELGTLEVVAHRHDQGRVPHASTLVDEGDEVAVGEVRAGILHNPGHTLGAISFHVAAAGDEPGAVFTGDTMFAAGCGRLFEGTAAMMRASLDKLAALPEATRVYFGHEYTAANLRFAAAVEPTSEAIAARVAAVAAARDRGEPTTPSTVALERATNPFVRSAAPAVIEAARRRDPAAANPDEVLATIRSWKDGFK